MAPSLTITVTSDDRKLIVDWIATGEEIQLTSFSKLRLQLSDQGPTGFVYYDIALNINNLNGGSYTISEINGVPLQNGSMYTIRGMYTGKGGITVSNRLSIAPQSAPLPVVIEGYPSDSKMYFRITNMTTLADQGFSPITAMLLTITDSNDYNEIITYNIIENPNYLTDWLEVPGTNNIQYELGITVFNDIGSSDSNFLVLMPSNLPQPPGDIAAYPTVVVNFNPTFYTDSTVQSQMDASSVTIFWQLPANSASLIASNKDINKWKLTRVNAIYNPQTDTYTRDLSSAVIWEYNTTDDDSFQVDLSFNNVHYDFRFVDNQTSIATSYFYSIQYANVNGSSVAVSSSVVTCGSLPSTPIINVKPGNNNFDIELVSGSQLNGFSSFTWGNTAYKYILDLSFTDLSNNHQISPAYLNLANNTTLTITKLSQLFAVNASTKSILNGILYNVYFSAVSVYTTEGLETVLRSLPPKNPIAVQPYTLPSTPFNVKVFSVEATGANTVIPVVNGTDPGLNVQWNPVSNFGGNGNPITYDVYINFNDKNYLTNIKNIPQPADISYNFSYVVSSYTDLSTNVTSNLNIGYNYNIYIITKAYNTYYAKYVTSTPTAYYTGTPITYPSPVSSISLSFTSVNPSSTTMLASFTPLSGDLLKSGGFVDTDLQYAYTLTDLSNQQMTNGVSLTSQEGLITLTNLIPGNPYVIQLYTQGLYTSQDTSSNVPAGPTFVNKIIQSRTAASASRIAYYLPAAPTNVNLAPIGSKTAPIYSGLYVTWDPPSNTINYINNGVKLNNYLIYCVDASYSGSFTNIPYILKTGITDLSGSTTTPPYQYNPIAAALGENATITQYYNTTTTSITQIAANSAYKVYVAAEGTVGGFTYSSRVFPINTIIGQLSNVMYNDLAAVPNSASSIIPYVLTAPTGDSPASPLVISTSDATSATISWTLDSTMDQYIVYRDTEEYINSIKTGSIFPDLSYNPSTRALYFVSNDPRTFTYLIFAVNNNFASIPASVKVGPNVPAGISTNKNYSVSNQTIVVSFTSPSSTGGAGGNNGPLFTEITLTGPNDFTETRTIQNVTASTSYNVTFTALTNNVDYTVTIINKYSVLKDPTNLVVSQTATITNMRPNDSPKDVTNLAATTSSNSVTLTWTNPTDSDIYPFGVQFMIQRTGTDILGNALSSQNSTFYVANTATSFTDTTATNSFIYTYKIIAARVAGKPNPPGATISNIKPSSRPEFASGLMHNGSIGNPYRQEVLIDSNGSPLIDVLAIGIPSDLNATELIYIQYSDAEINALTYDVVSNNQTLSGTVTKLVFDFPQAVTGVFVVVSNSKGMRTGSNGATSFINIFDTAGFGM